MSIVNPKGIQTIEFKGKQFPAFQAIGNAAQFCKPFADHICRGVGFDIGYGKKEWKLSGSIGVDLSEGTEYHAMNLPPMAVDYIFSSHCAEHIKEGMAQILKYWHSRLHPQGVLFLYLPDMATQIYWRMWHNDKHVQYVDPNVMRLYFEDMSHLWRNIFVSNTDLNNSFICISEKV